MADYTLNEPDMTPNAVTGQVTYQQIVAYSTWLANKQSQMPDFGSFDPNVGVPHFVRDGTRFFSLLARHLLREYAAHSATINPYLSAGLSAAITALLSYLPEIIGLDQPGPN